MSWFDLDFTMQYPSSHQRIFLLSIMMDFIAATQSGYRPAARRIFYSLVLQGWMVANNSDIRPPGLINGVATWSGFPLLVVAVTTRCVGPFVTASFISFFLSFVIAYLKCKMIQFAADMSNQAIIFHTNEWYARIEVMTDERRVT